MIMTLSSSKNVLVFSNISFQVKQHKDNNQSKLSLVVQPKDFVKKLQRANEKKDVYIQLLWHDLCDVMQR